jgi:hypothetical protein
MAEDTKQNAGGDKKNDEGESEDSEKKSTGGSAGGAGSLFSPEGVIMLLIAGMFDGIGLIPIVGTITDIIAGIFFAGWMFISGKKGWWKFALALLLEAIPIISDLVPFISLIGILINIKLPTSWIGCVYSILMGQGGAAKKIVPVKADE